MAILNPFEGLEGIINDINLFYMDVEENGSDYSMKRLKESVETAKTKFDCLTKEERDAVKTILRVKYPEEIATGEEFKGLYEFIESVELKDDWNPENEDLQNYRIRKFEEYKIKRNLEIISEQIRNIFRYNPN